MASKPKNPFTPGGDDEGLESGHAPGAGAPMGAEDLARAAGGHPTGRPRKDGLRSGSPEAAEADRERSRERKKKSRQAKRMEGDAAPLPSLGDDGEPPVHLAAPLPWDASLLAPVVGEILAALEAVSVRQLKERAAKVADAPSGFVATVEKDAEWNTVAKTALSSAVPQVAAKWLNRSGVSAENAPEVIAFTAMASIYLGHTMLLKKLEAMAGRKPANGKPETGNAESGNPPAAA